MGNELGATLIESLKNSNLNTTLLSKQANIPLFVDPTELPGVARAWVVFDGITPNPVTNRNYPCTVLKSSSNVVGVSSGVALPGINPHVGEYYIALKQDTFTDLNYIVTGSITSNSTNPISAANSFFVKDLGSDFSVANYSPTLTSFKIQTMYTTFNANSSRYAYASRVSLVLYK